MAARLIAAASRGGKRASSFDGAAIFRSAHGHARRMLKWSSFKGTYRQAFAIALREVWHAEKEAIVDAAYQATLPPVPSEIEERARELRAQAWGCRIDGPGNEMFSRLNMQARVLVDAARGSTDDQPGSQHAPARRLPTADHAPLIPAGDRSRVRPQPSSRHRRLHRHRRRSRLADALVRLRRGSALRWRRIGSGPNGASFSLSAILRAAHTQPSSTPRGTR